MRLFVLAIMTFLCVSGGVAGAEERKRIALLEFDGPRSASVRGDVMRIAAARGWVVSASRLEGRSVQEFAEDYEVDLIIEGTIQRRGAGFVIRIEYVRGATGRALGSVSTVAARPVLDAAAKERIDRELVHVLGTLPAREADVGVRAASR